MKSGNRYPEPAPARTRAGVELHFRRLEVADIPAVMALEAQVQTHPWRRANYEDCLNGRQHCWLAESEGDLVGFAVIAWAGGDGELLNIAVAPPAQGRGIGKQLLAVVVDQARPFVSMLFLEVRASNHQAIQFYEREQFFEVGHRPNYYPTAHGREDALILARQL